MQKTLSALCMKVGFMYNKIQISGLKHTLDLVGLCIRCIVFLLCVYFTIQSLHLLIVPIQKQTYHT